MSVVPNSLMPTGGAGGAVMACAMPRAAAGEVAPAPAVVDADAAKKAKRSEAAKKAAATRKAKKEAKPDEAPHPFTEEEEKKINIARHEMAQEFHKANKERAEKAKSIKEKEDEILDKVKAVAEEMNAKAKELGVRGDKAFKGKADYVKRLDKLYDEWKEVGREMFRFTGALEPYTSVGASIGARSIKGKWK